MYVCHIYNLYYLYVSLSVHPSIRPSVRPSICLSVHPSLGASQTSGAWYLTNDWSEFHNLLWFMHLTPGRNWLHFGFHRARFRVVTGPQVLEKTLFWLFREYFTNVCDFSWWSEFFFFFMSQAFGFKKKKVLRRAK